MVSSGVAVLWMSDGENTASVLDKSTEMKVKIVKSTMWHNISVTSARQAFTLMLY